MSGFLHMLLTWLWPALATFWLSAFLALASCRVFSVATASFGTSGSFFFAGGGVLVLPVLVFLALPVASTGAWASATITTSLRGTPTCLRSCS
ncbi:hypothetical protein D3C72_2304010 [compost metagenome]